MAALDALMSKGGEESSPDAADEPMADESDEFNEAKSEAFGDFFDAVKSGDRESAQSAFEAFLGYME